jgi:hypothetical protein
MIAFLARTLRVYGFHSAAKLLCEVYSVVVSWIRFEEQVESQSFATALERFELALQAD